MSGTGVVDAQLHARSAAEVDAHVAAMDAADVAAALLVQMVPQGYDNSFLLGQARRHPERFGVVGVVDAASPSLEQEVARWRDTPHAVGLRVVALSEERIEWLRTGGYERLFAETGALGVPLFVYAPRQLAAVASLAEQHPQTTVVLDHAGLAQPPVLARREDPWADLPAVLELARLPNVFVKLSAMPTISAERFPFADLFPAVRALLDAYGAERLAWGSDITRESIGHTYAEARDYLARMPGISEEELGMLLGGTLRRLAPAEVAV